MKNEAKKLEAVQLLLDSNRGTYIPQHFAEMAQDSDWKGIDKDDLETLLKGDTVENEWYWEAWDSVLNSAEITVKSGQVFTLYQDGDLWAICFEDMSDEEKENFGFEVES